MIRTLVQMCNISWFPADIPIEGDFFSLMFFFFRQEMVKTQANGNDSFVCSRAGVMESMMVWQFWRPLSESRCWFQRFFKLYVPISWGDREKIDNMDYTYGMFHVA